MKRVIEKNMKLALIFSLMLMLLISVVNIEKIKVLVYPFLRGFQHELIVFKTRDFNTEETEHFIIKYENEDKEIINLVAKAAEAKYNKINNIFNYNPKKKPIVIVYDDPQKLIQNSNLNQSKPPMGVYYASTIQIINPRYWIQENQDLEHMFLNEGPMVHEYTHLVIDDLTKGNYPLWFTEGMALYQEYVQTGYEWGKDLNYPEEAYTVEELTQNFNELDQILAYKRAFELVKNLVEKEGIESLEKVLSNLSNGSSFEASHKEVFASTLENIYSE